LKSSQQIDSNRNQKGSRKNTETKKEKKKSQRGLCIEKRQIELKPQAKHKFTNNKEQKHNCNANKQQWRANANVPILEAQRRRQGEMTFRQVKRFSKFILKKISIIEIVMKWFQIYDWSFIL
jgi:hypothetical protein